MAFEQLEANWQAMWQQEGFKAGAGVGSWDVRGSTLPPLNLEMLQAVRKRHSLAASLDADQLHPRQLLPPPS
eukprot:1907046-Pyramimonas_sp.AAC.1